MSVLLLIWRDKRETGRRVEQRISAICRWAVAQGHRNDYPAGIVIDAALPRGDNKAQHLPAARSGEVRRATWEEIDVGGAAWRVRLTTIARWTCRVRSSLFASGKQSIQLSAAC